MRTNRGPFIIIHLLWLYQVCFVHSADMGCGASETYKKADLYKVRSHEVKVIRRRQLINNQEISRNGVIKVSIGGTVTSSRRALTSSGQAMTSSGRGVTSSSFNPNMLEGWK